MNKVVFTFPSQAILKIVLLMLFVPYFFFL